MAREEADREDLMREATGLVMRGEFEAPFAPEPIVAGFRRNGALSIFFGASPVLQWNQQGELRRGYQNGALLKAESGVLVELARRRTDDEVALVRSPWSAERQAAFLEEAASLLSRFCESLQRGEAKLVRSVPEGAPIASRLLEALHRLEHGFTVADRPHA